MTSSRKRLRSRLLPFSLVLHIAGVVILVLFPGRWVWVVGCLVVDHLIVFAGCMLPRSSIVGPNMRRFPIDRIGAREVAVTFDDGPDPAVTPQVLDILGRHGVHATFFCVGRRVAENPEVIRELVARGHQIENHTFRHSNIFSLLSPRALNRELTLAQEAISAGSRRTPAYFRAPAGVRNPWLDWVLTGLGLELVSWTRRGFDTVDSNSDRVLARLLRNLAPGDILVLHDAGSARDSSGSPVVLRVLPRLLDELKRRKLRAIPIPGPNGPSDVARHPVSA